MSSKLTSMQEAVTQFVSDGDSLVIEGFTHLICFAAAHEIIRQKRRDLTLCRMTPDLIYDQMIGAGCARKVIFSWAGNPGAGPLYAFRRAVEQGIPNPIEIEEYTHFGMAARFAAGAARLPFMPMRSEGGSDLPKVNPNLRSVQCPYTGKDLSVVPALNPDIAFIHVQRADVLGNSQVWGVLGVQKEAAFASEKLVVVAEEIVDEELIRSDPNRTLIPGFLVDAVVHEPWGCHPSFAQGYYDRDNDFYVAWRDICKDLEAFERYMNEWVYGVANRSEYVDRMGERLERLRAAPRLCEPVDY
ncbi:MAG: CoA-transferase, partial [Thermoanaerobaculia bacterium]